MAVTSFASIQSDTRTEILGRVLPPLYRKYRLLPMLNQSSIDGEPSGKRTIPRRDGIAAAYADVEGAEPGPGVAVPYDTAIELTPVGMIQRVPLTMKAIRRINPGLTRDAAIAALESGSAESIPLMAHAYELSIDAHLRAAEIAALTLESGLSRSVGTVNTTLTAAVLLDAMTTYRAGDVADTKDGAPSNDDLVFILDAIGVGQLMNILQTGTGTGLAALWGNASADVSVGATLDPVSGASNTWGGIPIVAADSALQIKDANTRYGMLIARGSGVTGEPGSTRGFAEFCEGYPLTVEFERSKLSDVVDVISRWEWVVGEHTDLHGLRVRYKLTLT